MKYYIGADLGTSSLKLLLYSCDKIIKTVTKEYKVDFPKAGWSEQNPEDWWKAFVEGVKELVSEIDPSCVKGIGFGGQMHGLVILDKDDNVIRPVILWNDGRTDKQTEYLNEVIGKQKLSEMTANIAYAGFTAPKLLWLKEKEPDNFGKIEKIMLPKDYMNYRLTGVHCTDYSDASGFLLLDVKNKCWSKQMLEICGVDEEKMPKLFDSFESVGTVMPQIASEFGFGDDVVVVAGAGDNAAAAIGTGTFGNGKCNISLGTSGTVFISSEKFSVDRFNSLHSFCHADGNFHLMGVVLSAASCNKWFCEEILKNDDFINLQKDITDEMLGNNDVFFLPYLMGERSPINDTDARGTFIGMRLDTSRADMILAVLEGVAFAIRDNVEVAKAGGINVEFSTLCGGGAKSALWQKIFANVLGIPIIVPAVQEGPGFGAALLARTACEKDFSLKNVDFEQKSIVYPDEKLTANYNEKYNKFKMIYPALKDTFKKFK